MFILKTIKPILSILKSILFLEKKPNFENNYLIRSYWKNKKKRIRAFFSIALLLFNIAGFELSTPNYSLTSEIGNVLFKNIDFFSKIIADPPPQKNLNVKSSKDLSSKQINELINKLELGNTLKWILYGLFILVFIFAFMNADPFSKKHLLLEINNEDENYKNWKKLPNYKDIKIYAKMVPSNELHRRCQVCIYEHSCENSLVNKGLKRVDIWHKIFIELDPKTVNENLNLVTKCRIWHFLKYSFLISTIFLIIVFYSVRFFEYILYDILIVNNWQLLALIGLSFFAFLVLDKIDPSLRQLRDHLQILYSSEKFKILFKKKTCLRKTVTEIFSPISEENNTTGVVIKSYEREIQRLKMAIDCFASTTTRRMDMLVDSVENDQIRRAPITGTILSSIAYMYDELYKNKITFSVSLLTPDPKKQELITWLTESNGNFEHLQINTPLGIERGKIFGIDGSSVAAKCWRHCKPLSSNNNISFCYENQETYLRSVIALPVVCSESLYLKLNECQYNVDKVIAVLCVTSSRSDTFNKTSCPIHTTMLTPFASMINVQLSLRTIEKLKAENNHQ